jgi:hypothetical protein
MKLYFFIFSILITCPFILSAQSEFQKKETIKSSNQYYWGECQMENEKEASDCALEMLTQSIAVNVYTEFKHKIAETNQNLKEEAEKILSTYSTATLRNLKTMRRTVAGKSEIFHYISKDEVRLIFDERKKLIFNIYQRALEFEDDNNFGDALKWYYFAIILINSIPESSVGYGEVDLTTEIPFRLNKILQQCRFSVEEDRKIAADERRIILRIQVFDRPAASLDFNFFDGEKQINAQTQDGLAQISLFGGSVGFSEIDISVKYAFYEARTEIKEVAELWKLVQKPAFKTLQKIALKTKPKMIKMPPTVRDVAAFKLNLRNAQNCPVFNRIVNETQRLLQLIRQKDENAIRQGYADDPFISAKIAALLQHNQIAIQEAEIDGDVNRTAEGWELRKIVLSTYYETMRRQGKEYLILDFTADGRLYDLNFGVSDHYYNESMKKNLPAADEQNRQAIIKFVEKYRTAYLTRNLTMLDTLFAEEAVIIIGRVLKKTKMTDTYRYQKLNDSQPDVEYIRLRKTEFLTRQKRVFQEQKDILLGFSSFEIRRKNDQNGVYGLSMRQSYNATDYADEGYLFLLVDFTEKAPQIYVRSWQPQEWDEEALIRMGNFNLNR